MLQGGATVLIVKDTAGHVFGGFAADDWKPVSDFYGWCTRRSLRSDLSSYCGLGNENSFLFTAFPHLAVYSATGHNRNFQYYNSSTATLPNGIVSQVYLALTYSKTGLWWSTQVLRLVD